MQSIATAITESANLSIGYAKRLMTDVKADQFGRFATGSNGPIDSNHPAFVFGHLCLYPARMLEDLGLDESKIEAPANYHELFKPGVACSDDVNGDIYPPMDEIMSRFYDSYAAALKEIANIDNAAYEVANPLERMRERFSTMGSMHTFYMGGHMMMHLGQISAWRRAIGMPAA